MPRISALALAVLLVPSLASGARLAIKDVSSNSILVDKERGITYGPCPRVLCGRSHALEPRGGG